MAKKPITIRVEPALLAAVRRRAQDENRTLTNFIETILRQHLAASNQTKTAADEGRLIKVAKDKMKHEC